MKGLNIAENYSWLTVVYNEFGVARLSHPLLLANLSIRCQYKFIKGTYTVILTGGHNGVSHAGSSNGIDFGLFKTVWITPALGLDDWDWAGITYLSFPANQYGHLEDAESLPVYYQARNTWDNNIPGRLYHGDVRIVVDRKFEGIYS